MGQCRIYCLLKGIPLPELGSFEFNLLVEGIRRERSREVAFAQFMAGLLAPLSGMSEEKVTLLVATYAEDVYQLKYNYMYESLRTRVVEARAVAQAEDIRILKKVAAMTVADEPIQDARRR